MLAVVTIIGQAKSAFSTNNESIINNQWRQLQQTINFNSRRRRKTKYTEVVEILGIPEICRSKKKQLDCKWYEGKIEIKFVNQELANSKRRR